MDTNRQSLTDVELRVLHVIRDAGPDGIAWDDAKDQLAEREILNAGLAWSWFGYDKMIQPHRGKVTLTALGAQTCAKHSCNPKSSPSTGEIRTFASGAPIPGSPSSDSARSGSGCQDRQTSPGLFEGESG